MRSEWRDISLRDVVGIMPRNVDRLARADVRTLGDLADFTAGGTDAWEAVDQLLGKRVGRRIDKAVDRFFEQHTEIDRPTLAWGECVRVIAVKKKPKRKKAA